MKIVDTITETQSLKTRSKFVIWNILESLTGNRLIMKTTRTTILKTGEVINKQEPVSLYIATCESTTYDVIYAMSYLYPSLTDWDWLLEGRPAKRCKSSQEVKVRITPRSLEQGVLNALYMTDQDLVNLHMEERDREFGNQYENYNDYLADMYGN